MTATALVVDDEVDLCRLMQITLTKMGIKSDIAYDLASANQYLDNLEYDFCLTDLRLPDGSGLDLVKRISKMSNTPVAVITAHGSMDLAIEALKLGAFDFVNKPLELPRLRQLVENALKVAAQANEAPNAEQKTPEQQLLDERLIGDSAAMQQLKATIIKLARSQAPVFLWGESGTGKEVVARLIHDLSPRCDGSFVPVNCGAIPSELMESEFFGHKKGSFTGATTDKIGLFQQASGGTLFLDEVADLPLAMQVKLLRAIQEKTVRAIGDTKETAVDVRILSATHKDLGQLVQNGTFRQDLFYRINVIELKLPTLNEREADIPALAQHFLTLIAEDWQLASPFSLTKAACDRLKQHDFEGNVRELRNLLERAVTLTDSPIIDVMHLGIEQETTLTPALNHRSSESLAATNHSHSAISSATSDMAYVNALPEQHRPYRVAGNQYSAVLSKTPNLTNTDTAQQINKAHLSSESESQQTSSQQNQQSATLTSNPAPENRHSNLDQSVSNNLIPTSIINNPESSPSHLSDQRADHPLETDELGLSNISTEALLPKEGLEVYLQEQEKALIITALNQTDWNKTKAAQLLGTTFRSLRYRMKKLGIEEES